MARMPKDASSGIIPSNGVLVLDQWAEFAHQKRSMMAGFWRLPVLLGR